MEKVFWKSKTILFNTAAAVVAVLPQLDAALPVLKAVLPPQYYGLLCAVVVVGNIVLRTVTKVGIALADPRRFD